MSQDDSNRVVWIMRKPRSLGNFSIETSYRTMQNAWPENHTRPHMHTASRFTAGILQRVAIWREVRALRFPLIHITGDIHFTAIGLRHAYVVLTIHDLGMLDEGSRIRRMLKRLFWLTLPLRSCDHLIAVSHQTKEDIHRRSGYPLDKITVIPSVISPTFRRRGAQPDQPKPQILHIGLAENKNLSGHAEALSGLDVHLRIIGEPSPDQHSMLRSHGIDYSTASKLSEEEIQAEYAQSELLLFCSTLEGYGMPIIEAQTIGVPVITSDRSPMKETSGQGALFADPEKPESIRSAVLAILESETTKASLIERGFTNAAACSASHSAALHAELYDALRRQAP